MMAAPSTAGQAGEGEGETEEGFVLPRAPLPEIIVSNVPGSWAYDTMVCMKAYTHACGRFLQWLLSAASTVEKHGFRSSSSGSSRNAFFLHVS